MSMKSTPPEVRFWRKVDKSAGDDGCWLWTASLKPNGYGQFGLNAEVRSYYAHRFAWEIENGAIPGKLTVDHLCRTRNCVNVRHMELVTALENYRRAVSAWTRCRNDLHDLPAGGPGEKRCRPCEQEQRRRSWERRKARDAAIRGHYGPVVLVTDQQVREMRLRRRGGERVKDLAAEYGVTAKTADGILNGRKRLKVCTPRSEECLGQIPCAGCPLLDDDGNVRDVA